MNRMTAYTLILLSSGLVFGASKTLYAAEIAGDNAANTSATVLAKSDSDNCSDAMLKMQLQTLYSVNPILSPFNINIDLENRQATLSGTLQNQAQKELALQMVEDVDGIENVVDNLKVDAKTKAGENPSAVGLFQKVNDSTITAAVKTRLLAAFSIHSGDIQVSTVNGVVTLKGKVKSNHEREKSGTVAVKTVGVSSVKNKLIIQR